MDDIATDTQSVTLEESESLEADASLVNDDAQDVRP